MNIIILLTMHIPWGMMGSTKGGRRYKYIFFARVSGFSIIYLMITFGITQMKGHSKSSSCVI